MNNFPDLKDLPNRLSSVTKTQWNKLFDSISLIETTLDNLKILPPEFKQQLNVWDMGVKEFLVEDLTEMQILPNFDYVNWIEGQAILRNAGFNYNLLDEVTLCKLLTPLINNRNNNMRLLEINLENGNVLAILKALQNKIN